jgi:YgiT-type zinc finger domain-containing protein
MAQESEWDICPICGSEMTDKIIDYSDWSDGRLLVVRDVPVRECQAGGQRFFQARGARALERLFELDRQHKLEPIETMEVPVVNLLAE